MYLRPRAQKILKLFTILASLIVGAWGLDLTARHYPGIIGMHGVYVVVLFPLYAVACFYLLDFLMALLIRRPGPTGEAGAATAARFSWLPPVSLILSSAGFFLPFVSIGGILAGHAARRQDKAGQRLRGMGLANVGLITGYLYLSIWVYMVITIGFMSIYAILFDRG
jgi:hypothetical protein